MRRYLDIENNIISFIEEYNRNYYQNHAAPDRHAAAATSSSRRQAFGIDNTNFARFIKRRHHHNHHSNRHNNRCFSPAPPPAPPAPPLPSTQPQLAAVVALSPQHRRSIVGSSNSINSNLADFMAVQHKTQQQQQRASLIGQQNQQPYDDTCLRKFKSESDLLSILHSKNYRYYRDELTTTITLAANRYHNKYNQYGDDDEDDDKTVQEFGFVSSSSIFYRSLYLFDSSE